MRIPGQFHVFLRLLAIMAVLTSCGDDSPVVPDTSDEPDISEDTVAPATIADLEFWGRADGTITVSFHAPGDDGEEGRAAEYEIRYSNEPVTTKNWDAATRAATVSAKGPGVRERIELGELDPKSTYHFAVRTRDEASNWSGVSNSIEAVPGRWRTWYMSPDGTGDLPTLQEAIDTAEFGDHILLAAGTYTWSEQDTGTDYGMLFIANWIDGITIRSESGAEETILDGEGAGRHMYFFGGNNNMLVEGLTFVGGYVVDQNIGAEKGGAIVLHATSPAIRDCVFRGNTARWGGAIVTAGSCAATIEDCTFEQNTALESGGAIFQITSVPATTYRRCRISDNVAGHHGGGFAAAYSPFNLEDCLIFRNTANGEGGAVWTSRIGSPSNIRGCTIVGNISSDTSGIRVTNFSKVRVERCIVSYGVFSEAMSRDRYSTLEIGCCNIFGHRRGDWIPPEATDLGGNQFLDPQFRGTIEAGDFVLEPESPCLPENQQGSGCGLIGALAGKR